MPEGRGAVEQRRPQDIEREALLRQLLAMGFTEAMIQEFSNDDLKALIAEHTPKQRSVAQDSRPSRGNPPPWWSVVEDELGLTWDDLWETNPDPTHPQRFVFNDERYLRLRKVYGPQKEKEEKGFASAEEAAKAGAAQGLSATHVPTYDPELNRWFLTKKEEAFNPRIVPVDGERFVETSRGRFSPLPREPSPTIDDLINRATIAGDFDKAAALWDFKHRPNDVQMLQLALDYARTPADQFAISSIARGTGSVEPPPPGQVQRVGPQPDMVTRAFQRIMAMNTDPLNTLLKAGVDRATINALLGLGIVRQPGGGISIQPGMPPPRGFPPRVAPPTIVGFPPPAVSPVLGFPPPTSIVVGDRTGAGFDYLYGGGPTFEPPPPSDDGGWTGYDPYDPYYGAPVFEPPPPDPGDWLGLPYDGAPVLEPPPSDDGGWTGYDPYDPYYGAPVFEPPPPDPGDWTGAGFDYLYDPSDFYGGFADGYYDDYAF